MKKAVHWRRKDFLLRLLLSYILVPLAAPMFLVLVMHGSMSLGNWAGIVFIYSLFSFAAMVVLGTPLLYLFLRLGWTGFIHFALAGGICAAITAYGMTRGHDRWSQVELFAVCGIAAGLAFRFILFTGDR